MPDELWTEVRDIVQEKLSIVQKMYKDQDHLQEKEMQKRKMVFRGGFTNSCEKKGSQRQRKKGKLYPFEYRVPKNNKEK